MVKMLVIALLCVCGVITTISSQDILFQDGASGSTAVLAAIGRIQQSGVFGSDNDLLRRIAYVETRDGTLPNTFRTGYNGGIWAVDESAFISTKNVARNARLPAKLKQIQQSFGISWLTVAWSDLRRPLHSVLAARLILYNAVCAFPPASDLAGQARIWIQHYNTNGDVSDFVTTSTGLEGSVTESAANEFFVGFSINYQYTYATTIQIFVSTPESNPVRFTVAGRSFNYSRTATRHSSTIVTLPTDLRVQHSNERNKGIHIKAEGNSKIVVYGLSSAAFSSDAFLALPCGSQAVDEYEYYGMTYRAVTFSLSEILIVACQDATMITTPSGTVTLNSRETYLYSGSSDFTGVRITSTKPVSFYSNQQCTNIPANRFACDHLTEQIPPTSTWGSSFLVASLEGRRSGEIFRILAAKASTTVRVNCTTFSRVQVYFLSAAGSWNEFRINFPSFCSIESSAPILVTQFALANDLDGVGDPFMMIIPPVEQYSNNYVFSVLSSFSTNYITIYVATRFYQPGRIYVDSTSLAGSAWTAVYCSSGLICGYITRVSLSAGEHRLYHQDPSARVGVSAYGFNSFDSYGYPGGIELTPVQLATVSFSAASYRISEGTESLELSITRAGDTSILAVVMVASDNSEGTASAMEDYSSISTILEFPPGVTNQRITVSIKNDKRLERNETFQLYLTAGAGVHLSPFPRTEITIVNDDGMMHLNPSYGSALGGTGVIVTGDMLRLSTGDNIMCTFDGVQVPGVYVSSTQALCVSPLLERIGQVEFRLRVTGINSFTGEANFNSLSYLKSYDVYLANDDVVFTEGMTVRVQWSPVSIFPMQPSNTYTVDIELLEMNNTGTWNNSTPLASNIPNNGFTDVPIPSVEVRDTLEEAVSLVVVRVSLSSSANNSDILRRLGRLALKTARNAPVRYLKKLRRLSIQHGLCQAWSALQPSGIGQDILSRLPACPQRIRDILAPNSGFTEQLFSSASPVIGEIQTGMGSLNLPFVGRVGGHAAYTVTDEAIRRYFHPGTTKCFYQRGDVALTGGSQQHCCYNGEFLITGPPGGGTVDLVAPDDSPFSTVTLTHFMVDVIPFIFCCKAGPFSNCRTYYEHRPSDRGIDFSPPPPPAIIRGDPHLITLDGHQYTFNGKGEFVLIDTPDDSFSLQARMVPFNNTRATVFTAVVGRQNDSDTVQFEITENGTATLVNGEEIDLTVIKEQEFLNVLVKDLGNNTFTASYSSGAYLEVKEENNFFSTLTVTLPSVFRENETQGLMGSFNGNASDDLLPNCGQVPLPLNSSLQDIHELFGITWIVDAPTDSLFTYQPGESWATYYDPCFVPVYTVVFSNPALQSQANAICGSDQQCLFDVAATGQVEIGQSTRDIGLEYEEIMQIQIPVVCDPPCDFGVCVANNTCFCEEGYEGYYCSYSVAYFCDENDSPCQNGGTCLKHVLDYSCFCPPGQTGEFCEIVSPQGTVTIQDSDNQVYDTGENATLLCSAQGGPGNTFQWRRNGELLVESTTLNIVNITASLGGDYTCIVSNRAGNGTATVSLHVMPYFITEPEGAMESNGSTIAFTCEAEGFPAPSYQWGRVDEEEIGSNTLGNNLPNITFSPLLFGNEGEYYCNATSGGLTIQSDAVTLTIVPLAVITPIERTHNLSDNVTLECSGMGGPGNTYQWQFMGSDIDGETSTELTVANVNASDGGGYTCVVSNSAGSSTATTSVFIFPYFTSQPQNIELNNGSMTTLSCEAEAFPTPEYQWMRSNGQRISDDVTGRTTSELNFVQVLFGDEGEYYCNISSRGLHFQSETATLTISPAGSVVTPPTVNSQLGETEELICTAMGGPGNSFNWIKQDDDNMTSTGATARINITVDDVSRGGVYECTVTNSAGNDSAETTLNIAPFFIDVSSNLSVAKLENATLSCEASGYPLPDIVWYHNGTILSQSSRVTINKTVGSESVISVVDVVMAMTNDTGSYSCEVTSPVLEYNSITRRLEVLVQDIPEQPQNVLVFNTTSHMVTLTWVEPHDNNAPVTGYLVTYMEPEFVGGDLERVVNASAEMATITDLSPGVDYEFTITAYNEIGSSRPSNPRTVRTLDEAPSGAPFITRAIDLSSMQLLVEWTEVQAINQNGIIIMYEVMYVPLEEFGVADTRNTSNRTIVLEGLEESVEYNITVRAFTSVGPGPFSASVISRPREDAPASPPINIMITVLSSTEIMVTWGPVPPVDQNGIITEYEVMFEPLETFSGTITTQTANVTAPAMSVILTGLQAFVNYSISVRAYTRIGAGPFSTVITNMTHEDVPSSSPVNVTAFVGSSTAIIVTWGPLLPIDQNGIITRYDIMYQPQETFGGSIATQTTNVSGSVMSVTLMDLQEFVTYDISIRAYTNMGPGPFSVMATTKTLEDEPSSPPANIVAMAISSTTIALSWDEVPPIDQNGYITIYEVFYQPLEEFGGVLVANSINLTNMSTVLINLEEFVNYSISVRAYTSVGAGPYSRNFTILTLPDVPASPPQSVSAIVTSSMEIQVNWLEVLPIDQNGIIMKYEVMNQPLETFNGKIGTQRVNLTGSEMSVTLMELQEFVNYTISVRAYTSVGAGPFSAGIRVTTNQAAPSSSPVNMTALADSSTTITVTWGPIPPIDQNGIITEYEVTYEPLETFNDSIGMSVVNVTAPNTAVILSGLQEHVDYSIRVRAFTSVGPSNYSTTFQERTYEDVPSRAPLITEAMEISSTEVEVIWSEVNPIDRNGIITHYEVDYQPIVPFSNPMDLSRVNTTNTTIILRDLHESAQYNITVRAFTGIGPGPFSYPALSTTHEDVPVSPPTAVAVNGVSSTTIMVSWGPVPLIDQNGIITEYEVMYEPLETFNGSIETQTANVSGSDMTITLTGLEEFVNYSISVRAYTSVGAGPYSNEGFAVTNESVPASAPINSMATAVSSTEIMVTWDLVFPIDQNGIITEYEVMYEPLETFNDSIGIGTINVTTPNTSIVLSGLQEYVDYSVRVRAFTSVGPGPLSSAIQERTSEDVPSRAPSITEAMEISSTEVEVTWSEVNPIDRNGIITHYEVDYQPIVPFSNPMDLSRVNTTNTTMVLRDLHESAQYNITVRAFTGIGPGPFSYPALSTTHEDVPRSPPASVTVNGVSSTAIMVSWGPVPLIDQNGIITEYEVMYEPLETFNGSIETQTANVSGSDMTITLMELEEFVNYSISVRAYTSVGAGPYGSEGFAMTNESVPASAPINSTATALSSTEVTVRWGPVSPIDQNGIITEYEVMYEPLETFNDSIRINAINVTAPNTSVILSGLQEYVDYSIRVRAFTSVGPSPLSPAVLERTNEDVPSRGPLITEAMEISSTEVAVTWSELNPINQNGIITQYEVEYRPVVSLGNHGALSCVNTTNTTITLRNLQESTQYNFRIRAFTSIGPGPFSNPAISITQEDVPRSPPTTVAIRTMSSTNIRVSWGPVPFIDQNGIITEYEVMYQPLETFNGSIETRRVNVTSPEMSVTLMELQEFVSYSISVRAYTSVGAGPYSSEVFIMTNESAPASAPLNSMATAVSSTEIIVTWEPVLPIDQNGIITEYEVMYEPLETFNDSIRINAINVTAPNTSVILSGLQEYVNYSIRVRAFTSVGPSPLSSAIQERTNEDVPSRAPLITEAMEISSTEVEVTWSEVNPIDRNGIITQYEVDYQPIVPFSNPMDLSRINTTDTTITLRNLHESARYNITVRAFTSIGPGPFSNPTLSITHEDVPGSPPTSIAINSISSTTIMVSWDPVPLIDQNGIITEHEVMYQPLETFNGSIVTQRVNVTEPEMAVTLMELQEFVNYSISVRAYTSVGAGPYSSEGFAMTNENAPASAPINTMATAVSSTEIIVTWDPVLPIDQNGIITEYEVVYEPLETFNDSIRINAINVTVPNTSVILSDLQEYVDYSIRVRAFTSVGPSPLSPAVQERTHEDVPSRAPLITEAMEISSTEVEVMWSEVNPIDRNGIITRYEVDYQPIVPFNNPMDLSHVNTTNTTIVLRDLHESAQYNITVRAFTGIGPGPFSNPSLSITHEDVPRSPPTTVAVNGVSPTTIMVSWGPVPLIDQNGIITEYEVMYEPLETFNGSIVTQRVNVTEPEMSVTLMELQEFVNYSISVRAYTSVGAGPYSSGVYAMTNESVPASEPLNALLRAISSTEIMASWDPVSPIDQNGIITEYEVTYQPLETFNGSIGSGSINVTAPNTSVILIGLHEYVNYNIRVRAFTSVGPSPLSPAVQERTNEDVPSRSPLITEAMEISSTEVEVTWSEVNPIDRNGIITHYEVDYQPIVPFSNPIDLSRVNTTNTTIVLRDLHESAQYNITVRAFTSIGPGPFSHPVISITHEDVPRSPPTTVAVNGVSPTTIMVSWGPVPLIDQNGIITEYEVMYQPLETFNGSIETQKVNITEPEMSVTLMELQEFVNYSISVRAYTSVGAGPYSNEGFAITNESVPSSAPVNAVVSAISSTEIMVTWNPVSPIDQNGIITKYEVMYQPLETFRGSIETQTVNVTQSEMSMTLVGLQEFINYSVSIRAYTSVGAGPYSRERRVLTSEDAPSSSPVNMRALADSSTTIMVSWDPVPPIDQNGIITEYEVMYQPLETFNGSIVTRRVNVTEPEMSVTLMELQEFVNYSISLHAYTSVGGGPYNTPVTIATLQDVPSSSPQSVTAIATSSTSITVTWEGIPQKNKNGVIIAYEVEFTAATISVENTTVLEPPLSLELTGLYEAEIYRIRVRGYTSVGPGPFSSPLEEETPEDRPGAVGKPPAVDNDISTATSVLLQWDAPEDPNGEIVSSIINIRILSSDPLAFTMMGMGGGSRGDRRKRQVPSIRYPCINGGEDKVDFNVTAAGNSTTYFLSGLTPYTVYQFRVQSATAIGYGMFSPPRQFMTLESESTQIQDLNTTAINSSTVSVMWNSPQCPYGNITSYTIFYRLGNSIQSRNIDSSGYSSIRVYPIMGSIRHQCYIGSLIPYKNYTVHVQAVVTPHLAMQSELLGAIEEERLIQTHSAPDPDIPTPAIEVATVNPTSDSIQILIGDPKQIDTGRVILCAVIVVTLTTDSPLMSQSAYDDARAYVPDAPNPYYIAAAWDEQDVIASRVPNSFTVGNSTKDSYVVHVQGRTTTYINVPLKSDTKYSIFVRYDIYNDGNGIGKPYHVYSNNTVKKTSLPYSREGLGVGVAIVVAILLIIIIVLAIVIFKSFGRGMYEPNKSKQKVEDKGFYSNPMMDLIHHTEPEPVLIEDFENHVQNLHANDNHLFTKEHALIEPNHHPSTENSRRPENIKKNRYANITTYDHSRVKLEEIAGEPGSDYINASFIDGYGTTNYFIATQGPIQDTLPDFWRMVWEQESATVVMLTNCEDNGQVKCHKYWPEEPDTPEMHGCIKVTLLKSCVLAGYTIRTFSLQMERAERTIQHFHFTSWPDNCVPESPAPFLHFVQEVTQNKAGPMVVHCSDGVGRTGVFIALHSQLLRIRDEGTVDIFNFVQSMRKKRCFMVQTEPEYIFLHDALLEAIEHGETQQSTL